MRTTKESERKRGIHMLESAEAGAIQDIERKREMGDTHRLNSAEGQSRHRIKADEQGALTP
jgi:hypothetical protein